MPQSRRLQAPANITRPRQIPGLLGNARRHQTGQADVLVGAHTSRREGPRREKVHWSVAVSDTIRIQLQHHWEVPGFWSPFQLLGLVWCCKQAVNRP